MQRIICSSRLCLFLLVVLLLAGCATPIGVREVAPRESYRQSMTDVMTDGVTSNATNIVLHRFNLTAEYKKNPAESIKALHTRALHDKRRDIIYALAELSYLHAEHLLEAPEQADRQLAPDYFLMAATYAYFFLIDDRSNTPTNVFDLRVHSAIDLYNFALWRGMATGSAGTLDLDASLRKLPVGTLTIAPDRTHLPWEFQDFSRFEPTDKYVVRGLSIRNRVNGIGSPLIGLKKITEETPFVEAVPVTIFLRIDGDLKRLTEGTASASLEFYSAYDINTLEVNGRHPRLDTDLTTPTAYILESSKIWDFGLGAFLGREFAAVPNGLFLSQPYQTGRIPVVFVHGTFSNPARWMEMLNTLRADPILRQKFQYWYFLYNSSAPIVVSAADLREALRDKIDQLDPAGQDQALQNMVVVGHSQGGLLAKLTAVSTDDRLVQALTGKNLDDLEMPEEKKAQVRRFLVVEPVPEVKRVVFIATPHRGSILSKQWVRNLIRRIVTLPATIVKTTLNFNEYYSDEIKTALGSNQIPNSIDGMSPDNPILKALAATPLATGVTGHSIIAIKGNGAPESGDDGVVAYSSAHLDGMASEFIVRAGHSCQTHPFTIEEVRRILLEHLGE
ncbi:MAG: hypothetical protein P8Y40_00600 [Desulfobacterales bacterium]